MNISEREDELFDRWRRVRENLVSDGVNDLSCFLDSTPRILFLLKEVNDPGEDGGGWDLREFFGKSGGRSQTGNTLCRWIEGISSTQSELPWCELEHVDSERRRQSFRKVATMNLKKSPGGITTNPKEFLKVTAEDSEFIREQFSFYEADWVICCGSIVAEVFESTIHPDLDSAWRKTSRGCWFVEYLPNKFVLSYSHPEARIADSILHYGLMDAVQEISATMSPANQPLHTDRASHGG